MRLLLDTHILLWSLLEPRNLSHNVRDVLEDPSHELWLSPISLWEVMMLAEKHRIELDTEPESWIRRVLRELPFREASLNYEVSIQSRLINVSNTDPADRFLAATALVYGLTLVTADENLFKIKGVDVLRCKKN